MKRIIIALMVAFVFCTLMQAQKRTIAPSDTITQQQSAKMTENPDSVYVAEYTDETDSVTNDESDSSSSGWDEFDIPSKADWGNAVGGGILIAIISIIAVLGLPVFVVFIVFYFRHKDRKARYRLAEQALAAGHPLPDGFIKESRQEDIRSQGIKNTFVGIGLFIFLWSITEEFGIGTIGLLVMFIGIGQWLIGYKKDKHEDK